MKTILGLDLGSASIGWALISENESEETKIIDLGSRIIPYEGTEGRDFELGTGESKNALRTKARTIRRGYDRYQMRRNLLVNELVEHGMKPSPSLMKMNSLDLWELRSKASYSQITLQELGRIFYWLNQKRGYKSSRCESNLEKKDTDYVAEVKSRHEITKELGITIGQYFYRELKNDPNYRIKGNVFPREAYIEEFDKIWDFQKQYYPVLTEELKSSLRNYIIYYQRPLKSQKGLVSICGFESFQVTLNGKNFFVGPRVAPKSSPLFQISKIWESINNIRVSTRRGQEYILTTEQKWAIFDHLDNNDKLSQSDLMRLLGLKRNDCFINKQLSKGLQGNITKQAIRACLTGYDEYLKVINLKLEIREKNEEGFLYNRKTGEVINSKPIKYIDPDVEKQSFYQLWHTIYSINDKEECSKVLQKRFGFNKIVSDKLADIDFSKFGFGNKSAKAIRKILPYLMEGDDYSSAMSYAGYSHSDSLTSEERLNLPVLEKLIHLPKNSLRQPVVEKILNQMINVVNSVIGKYGRPQEIRIELARELKQSKEERNKTSKNINQRERENHDIAKSLEEFGLRATRNNIIKWRLYQEINEFDKKIKALCIYCGKPISITEALLGNEIDVEHIIPKSKLFDDSQSNKTLSHRHCNHDKNDRTAFDFMKSKPDIQFNDYVDRVNILFNNGVINKSKRDKFLMSEDEVPDDFIDRQLRESQYISRQARKILQSICINVWVTTGTITSELRHLWGWDDITMHLQLPKYKNLGLTETIQWESDHGKNRHNKEVINGWTKRDDQRHHAIDALTIACTKQGFIQRFNTLNASITRNLMKEVVDKSNIRFKEKLSLLERYICSQQPVTVKDVEEAVSRILISYKQGKKVTVKGTRKVGKRGNKRIVQSGILVPRGALSEESVYGKIRTQVFRKPVKFLFENPDLIFKSYIKEKVNVRLSLYNGDIREAIASLKKEPIYLDKKETVILESATCFSEEYVIRYKVDTNFDKVEKVVDKKIKEILVNRLLKFGGNPKLAFKDIQIGEKILKWYEDEGLVRPLRTVRCFTGLSAVVPLKDNEKGLHIGFVKPGNNHHIAIYVDDDGNYTEHVCTFWHAVERKMSGIPVIIENTDEIWDKILESDINNYKTKFLELLPKNGIRLVFSMQQNEMFVLGLAREDFNSSIACNDNIKISHYLYRTQKLGVRDYTFRHHLETQIIDNNDSLSSKRFYRVRSIGAFLKLTPIKVRVDLLGKISENSEGRQNNYKISSKYQDSNTER